MLIDKNGQPKLNTLNALTAAFMAASSSYAFAADSNIAGVLFGLAALLNCYAISAREDEHDEKPNPPTPTEI